MDNFHYGSRFNIRGFENMSITSMKEEERKIVLLLFYLSCFFAKLQIFFIFRIAKRFL